MVLVRTELVNASTALVGPLMKNAACKQAMSVNLHGYPRARVSATVLIAERSARIYLILQVKIALRDAFLPLAVVAGAVAVGLTRAADGG